MNSAITKRSVLIMGRKTSISLEDMFWLALKDIAAEQRVSAATLLVQIDQQRGSTNFSSAVRQFVMAHYINLVNEFRKGGASTLGSRAIEARTGTVTRSALPSTLS
jgi:predicted DNA-binding ribbon-helix-helix protein